MPSNMFPATSILLAILLLITSFCIPTLARRYPCDNLLARKEWRNMNTDEKNAYIEAVKCLQSKPAIQPAYPQAVSRFDEFQAHYMKQADNVETLGQSLPWHRHFLRTYEKVLREECDYKGANPYWDWSQDADSNSSISAAPVFDPATGFGGDGGSSKRAVATPDASRSCVRTGPFANYNLNVGPGKSTTRHCLSRAISDAVKPTLKSGAVAALSKASDFEAFRKGIQAQFEGGKSAVGGEMKDFYSSPGDPLFFLHIANIDRIWWNWQQLLPGTRFFAVSGTATKVAPFSEVGPDYPLDMGSLGLTVPIRDTLDLWSKPNCFAYV